MLALTIWPSSDAGGVARAVHRCRRWCCTHAGKALQVLAVVEEGRDRLRVFRADMGEEGSFDAAVTGCVALFHVAASMDLHVSPAHQDNLGESL
jgi:hypothetical protein